MVRLITDSSSVAEQYIDTDSRATHGVDLKAISGSYLNLTAWFSADSQLPIRMDIPGVVWWARVE